MNTEVSELLQGNPLLWRGCRLPGTSAASRPSGHAALDAVLPGGGWPLGALTELIVPHWGIGELRLLLPAMAGFTRSRRWLVWIDPPLLPYAPALVQGGIDLDFCLLLGGPLRAADRSWAMEKLLPQRATGLVLAWPERMGMAESRRLQLAAQAGDGMAVLLLRQPPAASVATLRLGLRPREGGLEVSLLKARGSWCRDTLSLDL